MARARRPADIYPAAVEAVMAAARTDRAAVLVFDAAGVMRFEAWHGLSDGYRAAVEGHSPWPADAKNPAPLLVPDVRLDPALAALRSTIEDEGIRAIAFVPLVHQERLLGKFMLYYDAPHAFTDQELQVAGMIAQHVAFGIDRARGEAAINELLERERATRREAEAARGQAEQAADWLARVQSVTDAALSDLALPDLFLELLARVRAALRSDTSTILLLDGERHLAPVASQGLEAEVDQQVRVPLGQGFAGRIAASGEPLIVEDVATFDVYSATLRSHVASLVGVPLRTDGRITGVLHVGSTGRRSFTGDDVRLLQLVADRAAAAIERTRLRDVERRARAEAEAVSRAKDDFLAMLAHELRNPLSAIVNAVTVLDRTGSPEPTPVLTRKLITRQATHLARLLDDLLDVARFTRGHIELRTEPVDLRAVIALAVEGQRHRVEGKRQRLAVSVPDEPIVVEGDAARLQQVVGNLLNNASKYSPAGGAIRVAAAREGREAVVRVQDDGPGIPAERLDMIFQPFTQVDATLARTEGGLGIGLTLVKRLVELHGGAVYAHSAGPGQGAEFSVRLPLTAAAMPSPPAAGPAPTGRRILVVEDNDDAREALVAALRLDGHDVRAARTGREGIELAFGDRPELVLIDIGLPDVEGYEVGRLLRQKFGPTIRLAALTGYGQPEDRQRSAEAGFDAHLVKPVAGSDIFRLLDAA